MEAAVACEGEFVARDGSEGDACAHPMVDCTRVVDFFEQTFLTKVSENKKKGGKGKEMNNHLVIHRHAFEKKDITQTKIEN